MIDFVKISIRDIDLIPTVWENPNLIFHSDEGRRYRDEIRTIRKKTYRGLTFTLFADRLEITGSLHKYYNEGIHNANDFSFTDSINVIYELEDMFSLDLQKCIVENLEFGLNVIPDEQVKNIVVWLKFHERNEFRYYPELKYAKQAGSYSANGRLNTYKIIKAYAKGLQLFNGQAYGHPNTFRFEIRTKQAKYISNRFDIFTLSDLMTWPTYERLGNELLAEWDNCLLIDKTLPESAKISKYQSIDFWENCLNDYRNKFSRQRKTYFKLLEKYPENLHRKIKNLMTSKFEYFLKSGAISTRFEAPQKLKSGAYSTYVNMESAPPTIYCPVTGLKIKFPSPGKKYLTQSDIKWYKNNDPKTYEEHLESLLTKKWKDRHEHEPQTTWFNEIAHKIRCKLSNTRRNPVNNTRRSYQKIEDKGLKLWPTASLADRAKLALIAN